jgi:2-succinyl-6-hydroxy-2,4-cyclohexadiene-1-carboxylate synthase
MQTKRIQVNQFELQFCDYPHPGAAILFLHFSGANLKMWQPSVPFFQDRYRLLLVDLRGHGKSSHPASGYHMDFMAADIAGLMEQLHLERAHVVGSSLGAEVGLSLAANYPQKVLSLVCDGALSNEYGDFGIWEGTPEEFEAHVAGMLEKLRTVPDRVYPTVDALLEREQSSLQEIGWWNEAVAEMERYGAQAVPGGYTKSFTRKLTANYFETYFRYRLQDYYARVQCPLLLIPGADLLENPREKAAMEGLAALAPHARIADVPGWQHPYAWLLNPAPACNEIIDFLSQ